MVLRSTLTIDPTRIIFKGVTIVGPVSAWTSDGIQTIKQQTLLLDDSRLFMCMLKGVPGCPREGEGRA
jgi:hypothetical protein